MSISQYASDAKIAEALAVLGTSTVAQTEQTLLQQLVVVAAALGGGGGGGGAATWGTITGTLSAQTDLQAALDAKLNLAGGTLTGQLIQSTNGAAATPVLSLTGTIFTGGTSTTTKPQLLIEPSGTTSTGWSTSGTMFGVNAPSGFATDANLADFQVNGTRVMRLSRFTGLGLTNVPMLMSGTSYLLVNSTNANTIIGRSDGGWGLVAAWDFTAVPSGSRLGFTTVATNGNTPGSTSAVDAFFTREAAAHIKQGALHATTPTNQTFSAHNVTTGTGAALTLAGGTGTATPGSQLILSGGGGGTGASTITAKVSSGGASTTIFTVAEDGITIGDNLFINAGTASGLTIASSTSQKLGFWGTSPAVQGAAITDVSSAPSVTGYDTVSQANLESVLASYGTAINDILIRLRTPGFIAT